MYGKGIGDGDSATRLNRRRECSGLVPNTVPVGSIAHQRDTCVLRGHGVGGGTVDGADKRNHGGCIGFENCKGFAQSSRWQRKAKRSRNQNHVSIDWHRVIGAVGYDNRTFGNRHPGSPV